eukprot:5203099-Pyramimonas_sp.AAC.2
MRLLRKNPVRALLPVGDVGHLRGKDETPVLLDGAVHGHRVGDGMVSGALRDADARQDGSLVERLPEFAPLCSTASFLPPCRPVEHCVPDR